MASASLPRALLLCLLAFTLAGEATAAPAVSSADKPALDSFLQQSLRDSHIPGMVAMVVGKDRILYSGAFGRADVAAQRPMQMDSIFRIASMTKPVTSLAVMMLIEEGRVGLEDPVGKYLPEYAGRPVLDTFYPLDRSYTTRPAAREISIRHLLTHTSGLGYTFSSLTLSQLQGTDPTKFVAAPPLLHDPGTQWSYGESTRVLGLLVEKVTGRPLADVLRERIFEPLGMNDTTYVVPAAKHDRVVTIHRWAGQGLVETPNPAGEISAPVQGDGGLHSTAADYAKFMQLILNEGRTADGRRLVRAGTVKLMTRNHTGTVRVRLQEAANPALSAVFPLGAGRDSYGLGFQVTGTPAVPGMRSPGSLSWAGIFNTEFWIDPARGVGGILLMQYLPFYDRQAIEALQGFEQRVYKPAH